MQALKENVTAIYLDSQGTDIDHVDFMYKHEGCAIWQTFDHNVTTPNPNIGNAVTVSVPFDLQPNKTFYLRLWFVTNNESLAISWLTPAQTAGKKLPYLFTQCEDIACRSLAPMQDTPSIKITYDARVLVQKDFVVKMSANETSVKPYGDDQMEYKYECTIPIPSYLIAIAVGDLEYRSLGRRVGVITEPVNMDFVANELENLETMLDTVEDYLKVPYVWGNYSILILPPSFPMGGMENPLLTFASPTIITGDKS